MSYLYETLALEFGIRNIERISLPQYFSESLNPNFPLREYQEKVFRYFICYWKEYFSSKKDSNHQLLFHMATGSGKTLIMAGLILFLYEQGYRNFIFFVNSTNIINKTRHNFLSQASSKYLFADVISIAGKRIRIREVDNFQAVNDEDINIVFSTTQELHWRLNTPRENSITYEDFKNKKLVLISDESHHINAETKRKSALSNEELLEIVSWEQTVNRVFSANKDNVLLEFTATVDLAIPEIVNKYKDKLIYDYSLKQFRKDGFSKEVKVLQSDVSPFKRALQAALLSQYRRKVFNKSGKLIKPVILFKSKTIKESQQFYLEFIEGINKLNTEMIKTIGLHSTDGVLAQMFLYFKKNNISFDNLIAELREDFSKEKLIVVNSTEEGREKQLALNSLEDATNEYRAVFAVDMLNEGWDVLNLFDIVRLYDTRDAKAGRPGRTTISEAQLIGRGARYCPFRVTAEQPADRRKFDSDPENEMRICEELYYHSFHNPDYISELRIALEEVGIIERKRVERKVFLKEAFKKTDLYKTGFLFLNEQKKYGREDLFGLESTLIDRVYSVQLRTGQITAGVVFEEPSNQVIERKRKDYKLTDFGTHVIRKALNQIEFYRFSNLQKYLLNLSSINEFISSNNYLGKIRVEVSGLAEQLADLSQHAKLEISVEVLLQISTIIASDKIEYRGTKEFKPFMLKDKIIDKQLNFTLDEGDDAELGRSMSSKVETSIYLDLNKLDWFVFNDCFGTSEEKYFIRYIDKVYELLSKHYDGIYLVRNERFFKIYNFNDGRPFEPDFVLFLTKKDESICYQIFIEPKGEHLIKNDEWKESFLKTLKDEGRIEQVWKGRKYAIWGMPFYNEKMKQIDFDRSFKELLK